MQIIACTRSYAFEQWMKPMGEVAGQRRCRRPPYHYKIVAQAEQSSRERAGIWPRNQTEQALTPGSGGMCLEASNTSANLTLNAPDLFDVELLRKPRQ